MIDEAVVARYVVDLMDPGFPHYRGHLHCAQEDARALAALDEAIDNCKGQLFKLTRLVNWLKALGNP